MSATGNHRRSATWWDSIQHQRDTPLHTLIDGYNDLADHPIPYSWLPGRARTVYGTQFTTWSDLADETITTLLRHPDAGISTIRAIAVAARESVARSQSTPPDSGTHAKTAIGQLLDRLDGYDKILLSARVWALERQTLVETADLLGVASISVQRNQPRAQRRFADLLVDPTHHAVTAYAKDLRQQLGPLTNTHTAQQALKDLDLDLTTSAGQLLLHLAGPYSPKAGWLQNTTTNSLSAATTALDSAITQHGAPTTAKLTRALGKLGVPRATAIEFIQTRPGLRQFGDQWVRWGTSIVDKTEAALHVIGVPATAAHITATIGDNYHQESISDALYEHDRFTRATKQTWALRRWGLEEYTGLYSEIAVRIDAADRPIDATTIVDDIKSTFPDVSEKSIHAYLHAPGFVIDHGMIRRRTDADTWPTPPPLKTARGAFRNGHNEIRIAIPVNSQLLRGSGQNLTPTIAAALGIHPGQQRLFTGTPANITLSWKLSAIAATVGSLRTLAASLGADLADTLVLAFNLLDSTVETIRIPADTRPRPRLRALLGTEARNPAADLSRALSCEPGDVATVLTQRGDSDLAAILRNTQR